MNTCELNNPANQALIAATKSQTVILQASQHRKMVMTAQRIVNTFDNLTTLTQKEEDDNEELGFYAEQLIQHFGADIRTLRGCITNGLQLADYMGGGK